jgi:hypothetical protein
MIGAMRCATGWIRQCLREHPDIYMPQKEAHYFDREFSKGLQWYLDTYFQEWENQKAIGEKTATYLHTKEASKRIYETNPDMKLVCSIRDPVERLCSHYTMIHKKQVNHETINKIDFKTDFVQRSLYYNQLKPFLDKFPLDRIQIVFYEDKNENPEKFIQGIYSFLEVNNRFEPPSARIQTKQGRLEHQSGIWYKASRIMLHNKSPLIIKKIYSNLRQQEQKIELSDKDYTELAQYFKEDILNLEKLLGKKMTNWRSRQLSQL